MATPQSVMVVHAGLSRAFDKTIPQIPFDKTIPQIPFDKTIPQIPFDKTIPQIPVVVHTTIRVCLSATRLQETLGLVCPKDINIFIMQTSHNPTPPSPYILLSVPTTIPAPKSVVPLI